jgi:hypothetical protein
VTRFASERSTGLTSGASLSSASHVEVDHAPAMVSEHDEDEEHPQARGGDREEIEGDQVRDVIGEERAPGLRGRRATLRDQPGDGALGHVDAELQEPAMDARGAQRGFAAAIFPTRALSLALIGGQPPGASRSAWSSARGSGAAATAGRCRGHDDQSLPPAGPDSGQPNPQEPIHRAQAGPRHRSFVHGELLG